MWCPRQLGAGSQDERLRAAAELDGVVGDQAMTTDHQIERTFALADPALPYHQDAEPQDVQQHAVDDAPGREVRIENGGQARHRLRRGGTGSEQRHLRRVGFDQHLGRRVEAVGDEHARQRVSEDPPQHVDARLVVEALEIPDLALPEDEHTAFAQIRVEAGEREAGLLGVGDGDPAAETVDAREHLEVEAARLRQVVQNRPDGDAGRLVGLDHV